MHTIKNKKIGIFSDIHIGLNQDNSNTHDNLLDFAKWASESFLNRGISDIIIPGDIFHNRNEISVATLSIAKQFFDYFKDFRVFISTGNHDCFLKHKSDINSISILDGWSNIHIIDKKPETISYKNKTISLIPWGTEYDDIPNTDIMFGHFEISSFYMNSYKVCEHGMKSGDILKKSPYVISGHFHKKDHRTYSNGQILYVGSPYQQNFGDTLDKRGIYEFNLDENTFDFIENDISPQYFKFSIKKIKNNELNDDNLTILSKNNIISLIVDEKLTPEEILSVKDKLNKLDPQTLRVDYEDNDTELASSSVENDYNSSNILKSIEDFIETLDIEHKKEVAEHIKELYNKLT
jgi:DNA repair exonuclease SbcCD nuclease subunit